ncbi:MAG TPA: hypothetical protein VE177_01095 [Candidatus Binatus sp.]|nr:hypothetical protein [Candidatus Binatus sp.]
MNGQEIRKIYRRAVLEDFPDSITITLGTSRHVYEKVHWTKEGVRRGLRYGTNPHQRAALYKALGSNNGIGNVEWIKWGKDGPSATNIEDGSHGNRIVHYFDKPAVAVMKHLNPSGVAIQRTDKTDHLAQVYTRARDADPRAAFGSVVVSNVPVDKMTAEAIMSTYVEVVYAPDFDLDAVPIFEAKRDIRLGRISESQEKSKDGHSLLTDIVVLDDGSIILEDSYRTMIQSLEDIRHLTVPTKRKPSMNEYLQLLHAWWTTCEVRSNGIVIWNDDASLAIGTGQQDRVGALENCIGKAHIFSHNLKGSCLASDGFFPKTDSIELAAREGITAIIQPGGSIEDDLIISACDKHDIAMVLTGERAFRHF